MKNKKSDMSEIWSKLNRQLTAAERQAFRDWRLSLWLGADGQRDVLRGLSLTHKHIQLNKVDEFFAQINEIPILEK